jgi:hypothetical protein
MKTQCKRPVLWGIFGCMAMIAGFAGCQVSTNNQTLPSPYYLSNNLQYYQPGPWFKLQHEADNMKLYNEQAASQQGPQQGPPPPAPPPGAP